MGDMMKFASIIPVLVIGILSFSACSHHQEPTLIVVEAELPPPPPPPPGAVRERTDSPIFLAWEEPPEVIRKVMPEYPREALRDNIEGRVILMIVIDVEGNVIEVRVVRSIPPKIFDDAAIEAMSQWKFKPAQQNGVPIKVRLAYPIEFSLTRRK